MKVLGEPTLRAASTAKSSAWGRQGLGLQDGVDAPYLITMLL